MGRPSKLNSERQDKIIRALTAGNTRSAAFGHAGVSHQTFLNWLARGEKESKGKYVEFLEAVKKAEADAEAGYVAVIRKASMDSWQAAAWWLERRRPADYRKVERQEVTGIDGKPQETIIRIVYDEEDTWNAPSDSNGHTQSKPPLSVPKRNASL